MQQDDKERKHEVIVKGLEDKIKELEDSLKEKEKMHVQPKGPLPKRELRTRN
jgi:hypothetical protein